MQYPRIYTMLKLAGHSPAKAAEIILDATRRDKHAKRWIGTHFKFRHQTAQIVRVTK